MIISYRASYAVAALLVLPDCAGREEAQQVLKLCSEVGHFNQRLQTLTNQAAALVAQNEQNQQSTRGIYLYSATRKPWRTCKARRANYGSPSIR